MPSRKGMEQCLLWLRNKMAERDTLDSINATVCYNVIMDLKNQLDRTGASYHKVKVELDNAREALFASACKAVREAKE